MKDLFGTALLDYQNNGYSDDLITWTNISDKDILPLPYLFRDFKDMPKLEQKALALSKGKILDVGCGSGSHALWLQNNGSYEVKAIDHSNGAIESAKARGVLNAKKVSLLDETESFDTILLLMNGTGIFQHLDHTARYLNHLKSLLRPNGQILIDSSDISYMYDEDDTPETESESQTRYYGELDYYLSYKGENEHPMTWLYLDFKTLQLKCHEVGLVCKKILDGEHSDYLAKISHNKIRS